MDPYLRNAWYMVGWEEEVPAGGVLTRTVLGKPMMVYRREAGDGYVAMVDRCPHRFAPLSLGRREGDAVVCGYHGLKFEADGQCSRNPFSDLIPPHCVVDTFLIHPRDGILWMWGGEAAAADPGTIADFAFLDAGTMPIGRAAFQMQGNYELITDNLMDLSHIEFVHTGTFGGGGVIFKGTHSVKEDGEAIWSNWWMPNATPPWAEMFVGKDVQVDHWLEMRWHAPATMMLEIGICPAGADRSAAPMPPMRGPHIITPETETSSHYFYTYPKFNGDESEDTTGKAFKEEDKPMIEAVQRSMGDTDFWGKRPVILNIDAGGVRARRRLMKLRSLEARTPEPEVAIAQHG